MIDIESISTGLSLGGDGIWYSSDRQSVSYPSDGNSACFAVEDDSYWFNHRNSCIVSLVRSYPPPNRGTIFDIGGGNGFVSMGLSGAGFDVVLVEPGQQGVINAVNRGVKNVICATTDTAKFYPNSLPAVGLFDVIEHIENDLDFLKSIRYLIKDGGYLYVTVPSFSFLWSSEDVLAGHFRRYSLSQINRLLENAGFYVEFSSYIFRVLPIPIFLLRALPYKTGLSRNNIKIDDISRDHGVKGGVGAKFLNRIFQLEIKSLDRLRAMHFGSSCLVVAKCH